MELTKEFREFAMKASDNAHLSENKGVKLCWHNENMEYDESNYLIDEWYKARWYLTDGSGDYYHLYWKIKDGFTREMRRIDETLACNWEEPFMVIDTSTARNVMELINKGEMSY